jgi:hypothetical protein
MLDFAAAFLWGLVFAWGVGIGVVCVAAVWFWVEDHYLTDHTKLARQRGELAEIVALETLLRKS